jgi:hypothetical protein
MKWSLRYAAERDQTVNYDYETGEPVLDVNGDPYNRDSSWDPDKERRINRWFPHASEEAWNDKQEELQQGEEHYYNELLRQETHDKNHAHYVDKYVRKGLKDTPAAIDFYRDHVVPYKKKEQ